MPRTSRRTTTSRDPRAPRQERSQRTFDAILLATETLLRERPLEAIGIQEICRAAGCTTGAFYARFDRKDDLLPFLYRRYDEELSGKMDAAVKSVDRDPETLEELVRATVSMIVRAYRKDRWLLRAMGLYARLHPEALDGELLSRRRELHERPVQLLTRFRRQIRHKDADAAARTGLYFVMAIARDRILFSEAPHASATPLSDDQLIAELSRMLWSYLSSP